MGMTVRAMFRVLGCTDGIGYRSISLAPTYQTRDGVQCEENKAFWEATPSGKMELTVAPDAPCVGFFEPGRYVFLDFIWAPASSPLDGVGSPRTAWYVHRTTISGGVPGYTMGASFHAELAPSPSKAKSPAGEHGGWENGINDWLFGRGYAKGSIEMQIQNLRAFPAFNISPGEVRELQVAFTPA